MRRRELILSLGAAVVVCFAGSMCRTAVDDQEDCKQFCSSLASCGLLPSPLGQDGEDLAAMDNCIARCALTDPSTRAPLTSCFEQKVAACPIGSPCTDRVEWWCGSDDGRICEDGATCVAGVLGQAALGTGQLDVGFVACADPADSTDAACAVDCSERWLPSSSGATDAGDPDPRCVSDPCQTPMNDTSAKDWCAGLGASEATISIERSGQVTAKKVGTCAGILAGRTSFDALSPGATQATVRVRLGTPTGGGADAPSCVVFHGRRIIVTAEQRAHVNIAVPADAGPDALPLVDCDDVAAAQARDTGDP